LETTGFGFDKCAIIQLAGIIVDMDVDGSLKPLDAINLKMRPRTGKFADMRALEINGYSLDDIKSFQDDDIAFRKFTDFIGKHIDKYDTMSKLTLVGYNNTHFDNDFLRQWFKDNGDNYFGSYFWTNSVDVMSQASLYLTFYRPIMNNFKLGNVADVVGIKLDSKSLHDGLYDVKITYKIFKKIMESGKQVLEFNEAIATDIFESQQVAKSKEVKPKTAYTDQNAWVIF
jgi:DNA polymerase-3 subunit epsilon